MYDNDSLVFFGNIKSLGVLLYTKYLFEFEVAGLLLLVGIIAAVGICYRGVQNRKSQLISKQNDTLKSDRIRIVDGV
jgi:NADH-quinone oxidoreductase subunit J